MLILSEYRKNAGYSTQSDFAVAIGVDRAVVAKWETGENYPRAPLIPEIAKILKCSEGEVIASITAAKEHKKGAQKPPPYTVGAGKADF